MQKFNTYSNNVIFQQCFSTLLKWLIKSKRKHQKKKVFGKYKNLPLVSFEFITEFLLPATTLCNGCKSFCTHSSLPFHHLARFLMCISGTICNQFPCPCSYFFHIRCLFRASWHSKQPSLTVSCIYTFARWLLTCI